MAVARPTAAVVLLAGLLVAAAWAAFAGGAVRTPQETWLQAALVVLATAAAAAWLGTGRLRPAASPLAIAGLLALVLFAIWTGVSLAWSVTPDRTWQEANRVLAYALVVGLALVAGSTVPRAVERVAAGWIVIALGVAVYALSGKLFPGIVDHATEVARLRAPLEYWNALALACVLGVPVALRFATARGVAARWRIASLVALFVLLCTLGMTYSRGGVLALVVAVAVATIAGGARLPGLAAAGTALLAAAPVLVIAWTLDGLTVNGAPRGEQIDAGLILLAVLVASGALLALAGRLLLRAEERVTWSADRTRRTWVVLGVVLAAMVAGGLAAAAGSERGFGGSLDELADSFTEVRRDPIFEPGRLLSTSSGNRWAWWREAAGAWSDEPVLGWGAGSFPVSRRLYRVSPNDVLQPHSLPLQFLAETGAVGALLGLGALGLLLAAAVQRVRRLAPGRERDVAGALLAAACAWAVHSCVDWDWDIPGVTVPVLLFLGVLGAAARAERPPVGVPDESGPGRALALAGAALLACAVLVSSLLPAWSDAKTDAALQAVADRSPQRLEEAASDAELAARLDPLAVRPLFAAAAVAEGRDRLLEARAHLLDAVERQPWSRDAWTRLARVAFTLADREGTERASARALALDPGDVEMIRFVSRVQGVAAPPESSPTATGTPLPAGP
jgi:O-antigen ligase